MFSIPIKNNSIDIVYTVHAIEPNGGNEKEILMELYRVTGKYLILMEPAYELANDEARERMKKHGYVTNLYETACSLGYDVIEYKLLSTCLNPLNPTGVMIISKNECIDEPQPFCCPITKSELRVIDNMMYSSDSMLMYPVMGGIQRIML